MDRDDKIERVKETVEAVAIFDERERLASSPFHLSKCGGCGAPSFQQPCSLCGFYPYGSYKGHWTPKEATKEQFEAMVERSGPDGKDGTVATWHARSFWEGRVDVSREAAKEAGEAAACRAAAVSCCPVDDVWDVVAEGGLSVTREPRPHAVNVAWRGIFEAKSIASGRYGDLKDPVAATELRQGVESWAEALHANDVEGMGSSLARISEAARKMQTVVGTSGNLSWAIRDIETAREHFRDSVASPRI